MMRQLRWCAWWVGAAAVFLGIVALATWLMATPPSRLTRDPAILLDASPLLGAISHIGILFWTATAAITLFTAALPRGQTEARRWRAFLATAGFLTLWLMLDDLFLFHEWLFPSVLGVRTRVVFAAYIVICALFLAHFHRLILARTNYLALILAGTLFAASIAVDVLPIRWFDWDYLFLIEDGAKLLGIVAWFAYFSEVCADVVRSTEPA